MSSHDSGPGLTPHEQQLLLSIARCSIEYGLLQKRPLLPAESDMPPALTRIQATFVTLTLKENLRGCIGMLEAVYPLCRDVAQNAFAAAFRDPRFPPLSEKELPVVKMEISLLTPPVPFPVSSEQDLLSRMRPGVDGLILEDGFRRGTFLPAVWEDLPDPRDFLMHLKLKAGLPPDYWSDTLRVSRYTAHKISE
ncbi:MAG TPA: AmmeMemoRadiSam system protein A [Kiritimatiellia bacterium]|nr:AmmeMemoRadiSam system protein A [Kiritimatiellia bacterium]HNR93631.1 AmmeMemoRadiSam system protein A [Kiritimatiellia bacterium]HNS81874.1 AmmeMemoRadiSam system protein A [Kiritimatiellia bacterium]HPA77470.1 AmmeMemoRadiSam system protein A [Kiritimatiellia bacterium]HQQ03418.1 AmmeMemoRadiSam system protein A [Kiritimatiellia bacterium]